MTHIAISKIFSYYLTTRDDLISALPADSNEEFHNELLALCKKHGIVLGEGYTGFFNMEKYSIQECEKCEKMMINRDKNPMGFGQDKADSEYGWMVIDGGEYENRILCEDCLPHTHRWGYGDTPE